MVAFLTLKPVPGAETGLFANLIASVLVVVFGFLFVTVSSRIVGLIGTSANPISGMAIATLMATCGLFLLLGLDGSRLCAPWPSPSAARSASPPPTRATPRRTSRRASSWAPRRPPSRRASSWACSTSCLVIGITLILMNKGLQSFEPRRLRARRRARSREGVTVEDSAFEHEGRTYTLLNVIGSPTVPQGKYLLNPATGRVELQWIQGIGSDKAPAPQAQLMSTVINGILTQKLPWGLVFLGVFLVIAVELPGHPLAQLRRGVLPFDRHHGCDLRRRRSCGGWPSATGEKKAEDETSPGSLYASGLIAAGGIVGLFAIGLRLLGISEKINFEALVVAPIEKAIGSRRRPGLFADLRRAAGAPVHSPWVGMLAFGLLAYSLYYFARKPLASRQGSAPSQPQNKNPGGFATLRGRLAVGIRQVRPA